LRKTHWIGLLLGVVMAGAIVFSEWRRDVHFGFPEPSAFAQITDQDTPDQAQTKLKKELGRREEVKHSLDYDIAFAMQRAEWACYDWRFKLLGNRQPNPDIAIIAVDERSLKELHQWPWPRSIHARLIDELAKNPPKALVFDILFIEPFTLDPAGDRMLVNSTKRNPWVIHSFFFDTLGEEVTQVHLPFPALLEAAHHTGYVNAFIDEDGTLRSARGQMDLQGQTVYLLSGEAVSLYLGLSPESILKNFPKDRKGRMFLNFVGKEYSYPYIPYVDVLTGKYPASRLAGKIVLVGSSATGTFDHYPTPTSSFMPGVEFHANVIDNLIGLKILRHADVRWTYLWIMIFGVVGALVLSRCSAGFGAVGVFVAALSFVAVTQWFYVHNHLVLDVAGPLLSLTLTYGIIVVYRFFTEEREKRMVKTFFSQQVSGELLEVLMENPDVLKKSGERREMTVFFSDVAGFTSISERLEPEELVDLLNRYLTSMTEVIFENGGYVDKYMGDGIMAFWNGLLKQADHAERACRCALGSVRRLHELNEDLKTRGLVPLGARIGVNTGTMAAGYMGSNQKKQFTVMGDNVNLGSRLEGANKAFGSSVMISEFTYEIIREKFEVRFLDRIRVPGKAKPVKVYELLAEKWGMDAAWQKAVPLYHEAIQWFVDKQFVKAREKFLEVCTILPQDKASMAYIHRCELFAAEPPADNWDGVFEVKSK
jgi:adenylate cyclase